MNTKIKKEICVIEVISFSQVVLNVGSDDGIEKRDEFIVYGLGKEDLIDPFTNENLGKLELFRGVGSVIYIQPKICILEAISVNPLDRIQSSFGNNGNFQFNSPQKGDFAKPNLNKSQKSN